MTLTGFEPLVLPLPLIVVGPLGMRFQPKFGNCELFMFHPEGGVLASVVGVPLRYRRFLGLFRYGSGTQARMYRWVPETQDYAFHFEFKIDADEMHSLDLVGPGGQVAGGVPRWSGFSGMLVGPDGERIGKIERPNPMSHDFRFWDPEGERLCVVEYLGQRERQDLGFETPRSRDVFRLNPQTEGVQVDARLLAGWIYALAKGTAT